MIIQKAGHYIVKVHNNQGEQYSHLELPVGYDTDTHPLIHSVHTGPHDDEIVAWQTHRHLRREGK